MKTFIEYISSHEEPDVNRLAIYECPFCGRDAYNGDPKLNCRYRGSAKCAQCHKSFSVFLKEPLTLKGPILHSEN